MCSLVTGVQTFALPIYDHPRFSRRRYRRLTSYELAARIDAFLAPDTAVLPIVAAARERWPNAHVLRIDPDEQTVQRDGGGYWVRAWEIGRASWRERVVRNV